MAELKGLVPRWEWRTFGKSFGPAEEVFAALTPKGVQDSEEIYLYAGQVGRVVKIRDGLMDVKELKAVNPKGLEQWVPIMKEGFPIAADAVKSVYEELGVGVPPLERDTYSFEQLLNEVLEPSGVHEMKIRKHRVRYTLGGCSAELTDLDIAGHPLRTIAIESEDPDAVVAAVIEAGLADRLNHNFNQGIAAYLEDKGPRFAVIDVGTNRVPAPEKGEGKTKLVGDVNFNEAIEVAAAVSPSPGGVGPMTIACLLRNTVIAACARRGWDLPAQLAG